MSFTRRWSRAGWVLLPFPVVAQRVWIEPGGARGRRRRRLVTRMVPLVAVMAVVAAVAVIVITSSGSDERQVATRYVRAWTRSDYPLMYSLLDHDTQATM